MAGGKLEFGAGLVAMAKLWCFGALVVSLLPDINLLVDITFAVIVLQLIVVFRPRFVRRHTREDWQPRLTSPH